MVNQSASGSSVNTRSTSMTSVPVAARAATAAAHTAAISASTSKPGAGAHTTRLGTPSSPSAEAHGECGGGNENTSVGSGPTQTSKA